MSENNKQQQVFEQFGELFNNLWGLMKAIIGLFFFGLIVYLVAFGGCSGSKSDVSRNGNVLNATTKLEYFTNKQAIRDALVEIWNLANEFDDINQLEVTLILVGDNKYGDEIEDKLGKITINRKDLNELRRYKDKYSLSSNVSVQFDISMLLQKNGYKSF